MQRKLWPLDQSIRVEFDTELLGLQHELNDFLSNRGFNVYEHYIDVEVNLTEPEIRVTITDEMTPAFAKAFMDWARENGFIYCFLRQIGKVKLMRRAP